MPPEKVQFRYFAQVGAELIEVDPKHVELHQDGAPFSTSAPILHYRVKALVGDPDTGSGQTYEGFGSTWEEAAKSVDAQLPKEKS